MFEVTGVVATFAAAGSGLGHPVQKNEFGWP
jgi:hypothetical protein